MGCNGIANQFAALDLKASTMLVYYFIRDKASCNEDGRAACSPRYLAEHLDYSHKVIRNALKALESQGFIHIETHSRRYTMVSFPQPSDRRKGTDEGIAKGHSKTLKKQHELIVAGSVKGTEKGTTGVTGVKDVSSVVDVTPAFDYSRTGKRAREAPFVHKSKSTAQTRYDMAITKAPDLPHVTMHIDRLFSEISNGHRYPWAGNPNAAMTLAALIVSHGAPLVMAAAERYFLRGDSWIEERAWSIDEFGKQFAKLIASDGITKRSAQIKVDLQDQTRPTTPRELHAQLANIRRRELAALA